jgi:glycine/D-amino acid oxidase-like deaminating enzyme
VQAIACHERVWALYRTPCCHNIDLAWSGILGVGNAERPVVREVEKNVFVGTCLGGIGVAIGSLIGEELAGLIDSSLSK